MKKVTATIVYPINVEIEVPDNASADQVWGALVEAGDAAFESCPAPVIHDCSLPELVNRGKVKEQIEPETQADFVQAATENLLKASECFGEVTRAAHFLHGVKTQDGEFLSVKIFRLDQELLQLIEDLVVAVNPVPKE